jgi:class 3 adenylate cyclase/tetratricopeptide (TPR) repeat protein
MPAATPAATPRGSAVPVAERRLVSVLFADLVGFTTLSESRDAEEVRDLLSRYFELARDVIARYGGTVEKFIGDAVMAVWGTPVAHEDDAERAVRTGLELVDAVAALGRDIGADDLRLRAGVLTGEAAVTLGAEAQGMVAGDLVNTAARLQSAAAPGTVLVGQSTYEAASRAVAFDDAGAHVLKGKELPVQAWRALRVIAGHGGFKRAEGLEPPFVGRDAELRLLKDALHATGGEMRPRLVSVMGIGGIGKSRLAWELFKYIDGLVETIYWHSGRCPSYGDGVTFWALGEMVRMRARITETEDAASSRAKLAEVVERFVADAEERRWIEPRLAHLLGVGTGPAGEREELFAAWRTFFERISDHGPTVMVFEDLQWADAGLIDFIEHTLQWARNHPILIVTLSRPELFDRRPGWGAGQRSFTSLHLEPLADDAMRKMLSGMAGGLPDHLVEQIIGRAEGVPLYAVETVRMLVDHGHLVAADGRLELVSAPERLDVPPTLHSLIASRLDALDAEDRALLQDASVVGKSFTLEALAALRQEPAEGIEPRLRRLLQRELLVVEADPWSPERGQYGFVQSMIREVAYQTLARPQRRARHVAAARYFESLEDDEIAPVVAIHYMEAYKATPAGRDADSLAERARAALLSAAERATALGSHGQALAHYEAALEVTADEDARAALWERAGISAHNAASLEDARAYLERAIERYHARGDRSAAARSAARLGRVLAGLGLLEEAVAQLEAALGDLGANREGPSMVELGSSLARAYFLKGDAARAMQWADKVLEVAEPLDLVSAIADALITRGTAGAWQGRFREAKAIVGGALALAEEYQLHLEQARALVNLSGLEIASDPRGALATARRGVELARKLGLREWEAAAATNALDAALLTGDWEWALGLASELASLNVPAEINPWVAAAPLHACRGDEAALVARLEEVRSRMDSVVDPQVVASLARADAWVALAAGRLEQAHAAGLRAAAADPRGPYGLQGNALAGRAALWTKDSTRLAAALRDFEDKRVHGAWLDLTRKTLQVALVALQSSDAEAAAAYPGFLAQWRDLGCRFDLALTALDCVTALGPGASEARAAAEEARAILAELGAQPLLERLEAVTASPALTSR